MKKIKKILALAMAMCMTFSMTTIAFAEGASEDDPIYLGYQGVAQDVVVPGGSTVYYTMGGAYVNGINGMNLQITDPSADPSFGTPITISYANSTFMDDDCDGVVEVTLNTMLYTSFSLYNQNPRAGEEYTVSLNFVESTPAELGSQENPEEIISLTGVESTVGEADYNTGNAYYYKYTAMASGFFTFWVDETDVEDEVFDISITNTNTSTCVIYPSEAIVNENTERTEAVVYVSMGDVLEIKIATTGEWSMDSMSYTPCPAANVTWSAQTVAGTEDDPIIIPSDSFTQKIPAGKEAVFKGNVGNMRLTISGGYTSSPDWDMYETVYVEYNGKTYEADEEGAIVVDFAGETGDSVLFTMGEKTGSMLGNFDVAITEIPNDGNNNNDNDNDDNNVEVPPTGEGDEGDKTPETDEENKSPDASDKNNSPDTEDAELEEKVDGSVSDKDAILDVSAPSTEAVKDVETAGKDILKDKKYEILELDLFKNGIKLTELKDKIKVTLSVFDDIKDAKWVAVYRLDNNALTHLGTVEVKDGKFTFETDHFSTYVFVEADEPKVDTDDTVKPGDTSDNAPIAVMVALAATAAFAAVAISKKRAEEN